MSWIPYLDSTENRFLLSIDTIDTGPNKEKKQTESKARNYGTEIEPPSGGNCNYLSEK